MRVDISGHGYVPTLNINAPVTGIELNRFEIKILLGYRNLLVLVANTPTVITSRNLDAIYTKYNGKQPIVKKYKPVIETIPDVEFKPLPEITEDIVIEKKVSEPVVEETVTLEEYVEPEVIVEEVKQTEESVDNNNDEQPVVEEKIHNNNKRRNKKRNRNRHDD